MNVARIFDSTVVNIEVVDALPDPYDGFLFVSYDETNPACIGLGWNEVDGFEQDVPVSLPDDFDHLAEPV